MKCPLCGHQFKTSEGDAACRGCPLAGSCGMVRCPNCGYEFPSESRLIKLLRKWREKSSGSERRS